jgi:hypothetical protein|tara:strand:+ start:2759 stop:3220 length:462 start_codon:yes stop_codon:yes gene_type:complete
MNVNTDRLVEGPFGSNACYEQNFEQDGQQITTWLCFGSGYTTSTLMTEGSKTVRDLEETSPELYKDLMHIDDQKRVWVPATITLPAKGMVFVDGTDKRNWKWSAVKAVEITEEERKTKNFPKDQTHKMDMKGAKLFDQKDFMDALELIGFYEI